MCQSNGGKPTVYKSRNPAKDDPDDGAKDDSSKIGRLVHIIGICWFIQKNACNDLGKKVE